MNSTVNIPNPAGDTLVDVTVESIDQPANPDLWQADSTPYSVTIASPFGTIQVDYWDRSNNPNPTVHDILHDLSVETIYSALPLPQFCVEIGLDPESPECSTIYNRIKSTGDALRAFLTKEYAEAIIVSWEV